MVAAYGSFLIAESFHVSGVLATVTTGLMMANFRLLRGKGFLSPRGQEFILGFWDFAAFLVNSVVFLLIGGAVAAMPFRSYGRVAVVHRAAHRSKDNYCVDCDRPAFDRCSFQLSVAWAVLHRAVHRPQRQSRRRL
jgi:hypothetical protein